MSDEIPMDDTAGGLDRRSLIKRSAFVGGALVWTTPLVQSIASPAFGAVGSVPGGGAGNPICLDRNSYYLKFTSAGTFETGQPGPGTGLGQCITTMEASAGGISNGTAALGGFVTVTYSADKVTATIVITGGYQLRLSMTAGDADGFDAEGKASNLCNAVFFRLIATAGTTRTYTATSTALNNNGGPQGISHLELVINCA